MHGQSALYSSTNLWGHGLLELNAETKACLLNLPTSRHEALRVMQHALFPVFHGVAVGGHGTGQRWRHYENPQPKNGSSQSYLP